MNTNNLLIVMLQWILIQQVLWLLWSVALAWTGKQMQAQFPWKAKQIEMENSGCSFPALSYHLCCSAPPMIAIPLSKGTVQRGSSAAPKRKTMCHHRAPPHLISWSSHQKAMESVPSHSLHYPIIPEANCVLTKSYPIMNRSEQAVHYMKSTQDHQVTELPCFHHLCQKLCWASHLFNFLFPLCQNQFWASHLLFFPLLYQNQCWVSLLLIFLFPHLFWTFPLSP